MRGPLVVVGDALLDVDLEGVAGRLSPDAPVPVLDDLVEHPRPGGAALAAWMAARDGVEVVLVTGLGDDAEGERLEALLPGVDVRRLPYDGSTPVKKRVRAHGQTVVRLDSGSRPGAVGDPAGDVAAVLRDAGAVLVADYGRGVTGAPAVRRLLERAAPVVWDPHPRGAPPVPGVRLVTPNEAEARLLAPAAEAPDAGGPGGPAGLAAAGRRAAALVSSWRAQAVVVTLGARGALLSYGSGAPVVSPAPPVSATDTCGAGDRFAVGAAVAVGDGRVTTEAVQEAVAQAAAYVAAGGPASLRRDPGPLPHGADHAPVPAERLVASIARQGGVVVATGGCFDLLHAGHVATLRAARRLGDCLVVCLNSDDSIRRLKGPGRPLVPAADRARVLEALECVDAVVEFGQDTPVEVLRRLRPHVWAKGGDYAGADLPETEVLAEWGGMAVVLPYLEGRSTSGLVRTASRSHPAAQTAGRTLDG